MMNTRDQKGLQPVLLLFGPQALHFDEDVFESLRVTLLAKKTHEWILDTVAELPQWFKVISKTLPAIGNPSGHQLLLNLSSWLKDGAPEKALSNLPNTALVPLVIAKQLAQYLGHVENMSTGATSGYKSAAANKHIQTLGFCTGLLPALAVACSKSATDLRRQGPVVIRLGMLIGMAVDAQDLFGPKGPSRSFATVWTSPEIGRSTAQAIESLPDAYISVAYDESRATVTTSAAQASELQQKMKTAGTIVTDLSLCGRFHWNDNRNILDELVTFSDSHPGFQLPDASELILPSRSNITGELLVTGPLHHEALRSILVEQSQWFKSISAAVSATSCQAELRIFSFGVERCVPPSLLKDLSNKVVHLLDFESTPLQSEALSDLQPQNRDHEVAVIGMSCKVPGADNLEEFWKLLCRGESQHREVPAERFDFETSFRELDSTRKWYGNFINGTDKFDHKFFKKSPRESASTDPQQRLLLEIAYQAVEQSGYFQSKTTDKNIGCYVGVCATDYDNNVACHAPNAFTATGNLRGFIAGKVSHYFGWTGPGLTIDTACSSSAVAVHQACKSILSGDCDTALAGGTHVMTNPLWFQNLAGATFLSTTGPCKPFDAGADGYCRGEGVAAVFLKRMSSAIADGDEILGSIAATAVQQNQNCTPIFVPNSPSLCDLFRKTVQQSRLKPDQITVVEAHGTGTPVGDPVEYNSVREVLGGQNRTSALSLGSVKGLVGHAECTSGMLSLIKILLMINKGYIPPQASFHTINPTIPAKSTDHIQISTTLHPWDVDFRAALINNYGASGSNASMIVTQAPEARNLITSTAETTTPVSDSKQPFWLTGCDDAALTRNISALLEYIRTGSHRPGSLTTRQLASSLSRQSNRSLSRGLLFSCRSLNDLENALGSFGKPGPKLEVRTVPPARPVILCFGGQLNKSISLDRGVYDSNTLFRGFVDQCNQACLSLGLSSNIPDIFSREAVNDPVKLQTMIFTIQYSCARTWLTCGVRPVAIVGHSFGELTGLCIAGVLGLEDTLRLIVGRASIIRDEYGSDKGAMVAIEAKLKDIESLLAHANALFPEKPAANISCYNGPTSFTVAGPTPTIDALFGLVTNNPVSSMRLKRLGVTNAYHTPLVEPLMTSLEASAQHLLFAEPKIPMWRATEFICHEKFSAKFVAEHMRSPVYFHQAVSRLASKYPAAIFLEAGSASTVTNMASRALGNPSSSHFQPINITDQNARDNLAEATLDLWKAGLNVTFWDHYGTQITDAAPLLLPPYQFEKSTHWLELKKPSRQEQTGAQPGLVNNSQELLSFIGYHGQIGRFCINSLAEKYTRYLSGHTIAQTAPICPATVQLSIAIQGLRTLRTDHPENLTYQVLEVKNLAPLCDSPRRSVLLDIDGAGANSNIWTFKVYSTMSGTSTTKTVHTTGRITARSCQDSKYQLEFARYERLSGHSRCSALLQCWEAEDVIQGRNIYKTFNEIVRYGKDYQGLRKLVGQGNQSAGRVVKSYNCETWLDAHLSDCFAQVGGIWVNCMTNRDHADMYIANGIEQWIRSPTHNRTKTTKWDVSAFHHASADKSYTTDVFVFDAESGALAEVILGISYVKVSKASMSKLLTRLTESGASLTGPQLPFIGSTKITSLDSLATAPQPVLTPAQISTSTAPKTATTQSATKGSNVAAKVKAVIAELSGLEIGEIKDTSELADLGIDSLMGMEMAREIETCLKCSLPMSQLAEITTLAELMNVVSATVGATRGDSACESGDLQSLSDDEPTPWSDFDFSPSASVESMSSTGSPAMSVIVEAVTKSTLIASDAVPQIASSRCRSLGNATLAQARKDSGSSTTPSGPLELPTEIVLDVFRSTKEQTDSVIAEQKCDNYVSAILPRQNELCISLILEAFERLNCSLRDAAPGTLLDRVQHVAQHEKLVDYLYMMLEKEAALVIKEHDSFRRTATAVPSGSSQTVLADLLCRFPAHANANLLTHYAGSHLAEVLTGNADGIQLIFGSDRGRELVSALYGDWPVNRLYYKQMENFLTRLAQKLNLQPGQPPLRILEMGAGTGGTTKWLVPLLASLNIPIEYTFTDLAPSFVAAARKRFKQYPFMKFRTHDIESAPAADLVGSQHIVIASNAVHATHSLTKSAGFIRDMLRPDGLLLMLEMTATMYWCDIVFGLFEGWWHFDDGRVHAVCSEKRWESELQSIGYGVVDWTDGRRQESHIERVILAMASARDRYADLPSALCCGAAQPLANISADCTARKVVIDEYVHRHCAGFVGPSSTAPIRWAPGHPTLQHFLVTGATGSLGSHLVAALAKLPEVQSIVCVNRRNKHKNATTRQLAALEERGIVLTAGEQDKLQVYEADLAKPKLGLPHGAYQHLTSNVTHIIHNAWMMNANLPIKAFEPQFLAMRNMIDLACDISNKRAHLGAPRPVTLQFISSIAVVGHYPLLTHQALVPEERMAVEAVLPNGYGDAKYICELMLDSTLHKFPQCFRSTAVRIGQIAGSKLSGSWNPIEHLPFLWKSSQTLQALPDFRGLASWTPVDDVAGALVDLSRLETTPYPIYHIDNPVRQPWSQLTPLLASCLGVPACNIVPFEDWVQLVRDYQQRRDAVPEANPAIRLIDFLDGNFTRMSCGGLLLDTRRALEHSRTLQNTTPVSDVVVKKYFEAWKVAGFLR